MGESFDDVHIITLKSDIAEWAVVQAWETVSTEDVLTITEEQLMASAKQLLADGKVDGRESVTVDEFGIEVCIDTETTEEPEATSRALDMVAEALDQLDGQHGTIFFSEAKVYRLSEIPWLVTQ